MKRGRFPWFPRSESFLDDWLMRSVIYRVYVAKYVLCDIEFIFRSRLTLRLLQVDFIVLTDIFEFAIVSCSYGFLFLVAGVMLVDVWLNFDLYLDEFGRSEAFYGV